MPYKGYKQTQEHKEKQKINTTHRYEEGQIFGFQKGNNFGCINKGRKCPWSGKNGFKKGHHYNKGIKRTIFLKNKLSLIHKFNWLNGKEKLNSGNWKKGKECPYYIDGNSISGGEKYNYCFTKEIKDKIFSRDDKICQICNENGNVVHHIDYIKNNNCENNLLTLCQRCHAKTNHNRDYWKWQLNIFMNLFHKSDIELKGGIK